MQNKIELKPNQKILFIGDSITDADRNSRTYKPFGFGYVNFVANFLLGKYPTYNLDILNTGISGDTIRDLKSRWQKDCLDHNPDILSIMIGVNDVWYQFDTEDELPYAVLLDEYETTYRQLVTLVKQKCNSQIVICEPFMFCDDFNNPMFAHLRTFVEAVHRIADDFNACLVPLQKAIDERIKEVPPQNWSADSVHPEVWAHAWIAQQWLIAAGL
ncbi:MAG: SGNH/GDSL hydrolase family protein [Sedimentisphaerales bacterium]|jgi:lysophospholipase L1-like esterase